MKRFFVRVTELHTGTVWVDAETASDAEKIAMERAECSFNSVQDSEVIIEQEIIKAPQ